MVAAESRISKNLNFSCLAQFEVEKGHFKAATSDIQVPEVFYTL